MNAPHQNIKGIIWDLDGTIYENTPAMQDAWLQGFYQTAHHYGLGLTREEADQKTWDGFRRYGHAVRAYSIEHGIDENEFCERLLSFVDVTLVPQCQETRAHFNHHKEKTMAILTSAHKKWAHPVLRHIGLDHLFPEDRVVAYDDTSGELKSHSEKPFRMAAATLHLPPTDLIMVEDTAANLVIAKDLGMRTVLVTHGEPLATHPVHVDFVVSKAYDVFNLMRDETYV